MVELRKRKDPPPAPAPATKRKSTAKAKSGPAKAIETVKEKVEETVAAVSNGSTGKKGAAAKSSGPPAVGDVVELEGFGGEVEEVYTTKDGKDEIATVTLKSLVDESKAGVVLFTYPKANTGGCTKQAIAFKDDYKNLTSTELDIYGLSTDTTKANTNFRAKNDFPYALLCDPKGVLISAIGLKKKPSGTMRGIFVIDKSGKVLAAEPGSPTGTVDVVKKLVEETGGKGQEDAVAGAELERKKTEDQDKAAVAGEVADSAQNLDK